MVDLRQLPKAELHLHFEAAMDRTSALELADRYGRPVPETGPFRDLGHFVVAYEQARDLVGRLDDLRELGRRIGERQRDAGVIWTEVHLIPATYGGRLGPADGIVEAVLDGLRAGAGAEHVGLVIGVNRGLPPSDAEDMVGLALRWAGYGVVALGLAGDEANHPATLFHDLFRRAKAAGLPAVPHAGEGADADSVQQTLEALSPSRICHGVRAAEDPEVLALLLERQVCLDMAPHSNVLLGVVPRLEDHPLPALMRAGVPVTLSTDAPLFTGLDLLEEYAACARAWDLTEEEVTALARASITRSFCPESLRSATVQARPEGAAT